MDLLGVGPLELIFVLLITFLVLGPKDIVKAGKKIGRFLSTFRRSEFWRGVTQVTREVRDLPSSLMREAELEDLAKELKQNADEIKEISRELQQERLAKEEILFSPDSRAFVEKSTTQVEKR